MKKKILVIPIEIQSRELDGALLLIHEAIKNGWIVLVGQKQKIFPILSQIKNSFFFLKSIVPGEISLLKKIKKNNNYICTLDVETLITANLENSLKQRYNTQTINLADLILFWGQYHFDNFKNTFKQLSTEQKDKLMITGSPIIDVVNLKKKLKKKIKVEKKILIIPSFGFANSVEKTKNVNLALDSMGVKDLISDIKDNKNNNKSTDLINYLKLNFESQNEGMKSFKKLIIHLSKVLTDYQILIRPHPMEKNEDWKECTAQTNVKIDNEKNLFDQIASSEVVIHFNSTASIQSVLMGKKTILFFDIDKRFKKIINPILEDISLVSNNLRSIEKLIIENHQIKTSNLLNYLKFTTFDKNLNSSKLIIDKIKNSIANNKNHLDPDNIFPNKFHYYSSYFWYELKNYIVIYLLSFLPFIKRYKHGKIIRNNPLSRPSLIKQKWPKISIMNFKKKLFELIELKEENSDNIIVKKYYGNSFVVYKNF